MLKCIKCGLRVWYEKGLMQCECIEIEMAHLEHGLAKYPPEWQEATDTVEDEHLLVWWLSGEDCGQLAGVINLLPLPAYIKGEFSSRLGRPTRGRLWIDGNQFGDYDGLTWNESVPISEALEGCGGIVIWKHHAPFIERLPGFITDTQLRLFVCGKPVDWPERK